MGQGKVFNGVEITVIDLQKKIPVYPQKIRKLILETLKKEGLKKRGEITVCFTNDALIRKLNARYLRKNKPTDVLAFDITNSKDKRQLSADIVISSDTAIRNARIFKTTPFYELSLYSIHGLLHLLGYDDHSRKNKKIMRGKELKYVHT